MAFKQSPNKKARLEDMGKTALIKTVRTLQRRETRLLNQVAALEKAQDKITGVAAAAVSRAQDKTAALQNTRLRAGLCAVEFGYRAGTIGDSLDATLSKWGALPRTEDVAEVAAAVPRFPWEEQ